MSVFNHSLFFWIRVKALKVRYFFTFFKLNKERQGVLKGRTKGGQGNKVQNLIEQ